MHTLSLSSISASPTPPHSLQPSITTPAISFSELFTLVKFINAFELKNQIFGINKEMGTEANGAVQNPTETMQETVEELLEAARYDDLDDLIRLASTGISLDSKDSQGRTALHMAAANGHLEIVEYLIGSGVNVNASNVENNTPLHWACLNGHVEVVKKLVLSGANVSLLNCHERTPIDEAVIMGKMNVIDAIDATIAELELTGVNVS